MRTWEARVRKDPGLPRTENAKLGRRRRERLPVGTVLEGPRGVGDLPLVRTVGRMTTSSDFSLLSSKVILEKTILLPFGEKVGETS